MQEWKVWFLSFVFYQFFYHLQHGIRKGSIGQTLCAGHQVHVKGILYSALLLFCFFEMATCSPGSPRTLQTRLALNLLNARINYVPLCPVRIYVVWTINIGILEVQGCIGVVGVGLKILNLYFLCVYGIKYVWFYLSTFYYRN